MSTKKINKQLNKIKNLVSTLEEDESLSAIEHQLLLDYIKRLYEEAMSVKVSGGERVKPKKSLATPVESVVHVVEEVPTPPAPAPVVTPVVPEAVVASNIAPPPAPAAKAIAEPVITPPAPTPVVKAEPKQEAFIAPEPSPAEKEIDQKLLDLFIEAKKQDLGGKLSQAPIKDLRKAFGINEKIFTIQELFGGDNQAYDEAINHLNGLDQYAVAREYLISGVADKYQWGKEKRFKKASKFIQLVRRRYN